MSETYFSTFENDEGLKIDDFRSVITFNTYLSLAEICKSISSGEILLQPHFQRRSVWNKPQRSRYIESLFLNIPIPPILFAQNTSNEYSYLVIDGKQRIETIYSFFSDLFLGSDKLDLGFDFRQLSNLEVLSDLSQKSIEKILDNNSYGINFDELLKIKVPVVMLKSSLDSPDYLYSIFSRLNTGSTPLSPQELRRALYPGKMSDFIENKGTDKAILDALNIDNPDTHMRDDELLLRFFAFKFRLVQYRAPLRTFLNKSLDDLNKKMIDSDFEIQVKSEFKKLQSFIQFSLKTKPELI